VTTSGLQVLVALFANWVNRNQQQAINYLQAENRFLREQLGPRRLRFSDADRRRLAVAAWTSAERSTLEPCLVIPVVAT
jgi:hypothetical protein